MMTMMNKINTVRVMPSDRIGTVSGQKMKQDIVQGTGSPTRMSNTLLPIELETAMSPYPRLATLMEDIKSGTDVPAARSVKPITVSGIPAV